MPSVRLRTRRSGTDKPIKLANRSANRVKFTLAPDFQATSRARDTSVVPTEVVLPGDTDVADDIVDVVVSPVVVVVATVDVNELAVLPVADVVPLVAVPVEVSAVVTWRLLVVVVAAIGVV